MVARNPLSAQHAEQFKALPSGLLHPHQFRALVNNIGKQYEQASPETKEAGRLWYPQAHDIATQLTHGDTSRGAGILAALSPGQNWDLNIAQAQQFAKLKPGQLTALQNRDRSGLAGTPLNSQSTDNILKAHRVGNLGERPEDVLPMDVKTGNFYKNILNPSDPHPVTIDTHAHDIAINRKLPWATSRGLSAKGRYTHFADAYRQAGVLLGDGNGANMQATTWINWRQNLGGRRGS